jgi:hypothetical protein
MSLAVHEECEKYRAEIERLKAEFQKAKEWNQLTEIQIKNLQEVVKHQDDLLTQAADALEEDHEVIKDFFSKATVRDKFLPLIAELREATK